MSGDLLNKLGKQSATNGNAPANPSSANSNTVTLEDRGTDLLGRAASGQDNVSAKTQSTPTASDASKPNATVETVSNKDEGNSDWTTDSALKEIKKLRDENKAYRIKYEEKLDQLKLEAEAKVKAKEEEFANLKSAQAELDRIKAEQEDKKRDLNEKVAHREARLAELQALMTEKEKQYQNLLKHKEDELSNFRAKHEAEAQVYKARLEEEIGKIPEKFKDYAELLVKGSGDPREALTVITEAKLKGMFEDKTVVVNHSVPNAYDGARSSKERLEEAEKAKRANMSSSQKIGEALKQIKSGNSNSVFRK